MMVAVELTSDEDALISLLRGETGEHFNIMISNYGPSWTTTITTDQGMVIGEGSTFRRSFLNAFGYVERPAETAAPNLRIVASESKSGVA